MPQLINQETGQPEKITARFTKSEMNMVKERAAGLGISPSVFAREAILSATKATATERLLLAKLCKLDLTLQGLFFGLFTQLNRNKCFDEQAYTRVLEAAGAAQYRKADELLADYSALPRNGHDENGNHA